MRIPVYVHDAEFVEPPAPVYHLVAANGIFLVNRTALFTSVTAARTASPLLRREPSLTLDVPKVPRPIVERLYGFFRAVYDRWDAEAVAFIYYAPGARAFRIGIPPQTVWRVRCAGGWRTARRVSYGYERPPERFVKLGDAHSHADSPAFFSCTDDQDDVQDGLKITLGSLHRRPPDVSVSFVGNGTRFLLRPDDALEEFCAPLTPPRAWLGKVTCRRVGADEGVTYGQAL